MFIIKKFEEKVNNLVIQTKKRYLAKKILNITKRSISKKITMKDSF